MGSGRPPVPDYCAEYAKRRDLIYNGLRDAGYDVVKPGGAFYIFPKCPIEESRFMEMVLARNCLVVPGSVLSERKSHFRISFAASENTLKQGIEVLRDVINEIRAS